MGYKWKPSASQKREFAERMKDPEEQKAYEDRKRAKNTYSDDPRSFKYKSFIPTQFQYEEALKFLSNRESLIPEQIDACNQVMSGYSSQEKIHHDYIHIVNELTRNGITE